MIERVELLVRKILDKNPYLRKIMVNVYQRISWFFSKKIIFDGPVSRITPQDDYEYFFGYYDKDPLSSDGKYCLSLRAKNSTNKRSLKFDAEIALINLNTNKINIIGKTKTWNTQQGSRLQWLGPDFKSKILLNDFINDELVSKVIDINGNILSLFSVPTYDITSNGKTILSLDFYRLNTLREGYGYINRIDKTANDFVPNNQCLTSYDVVSNKSNEIVKYSDLLQLNYVNTMNNAFHKVNHIMINREGTKFIFLHRWKTKKKTYSRLIVCDIDGSNIKILADEGFVSHCNWIDENNIIGYLKIDGSTGYFKLNVCNGKYVKLDNFPILDGHPSYSASSNFFTTDTYPNRKRIQSIFYLKDSKRVEIAKFFSPFKYRGVYRCDLHPRITTHNDKIFVDSACTGKRAIFSVDIDYKERDYNV